MKVFKSKANKAVKKIKKIIKVEKLVTTWLRGGTGHQKLYLVKHSMIAKLTYGAQVAS